jgi:predicted nuclease with TOPRIM domain
MFDMNQNIEEVYNYFDKKLEEVAEENKTLGIKMQNLKNEYYQLEEKFKINIDIIKEYIEIQKKLR